VQASTPTKKRTGTQEGEIRKKMKYHKNPQYSLLQKTMQNSSQIKSKIEGKMQYIATEVQREEIMEKLVEVHDILQRLQQSTIHHPTTQQKEKEQKHQYKKNRKRQYRQ
jgi:hypothetical protein